MTHRASAASPSRSAPRTEEGAAPVAKKARRSRAGAPVHTRERLIQASIELFNRYGVPNVSLSQIAAAVGISQGNLTYHFKKRDDLVFAAFLVLEERMRDALLPKALSPEDPDDAAAVLLKIIRTFWEFRFLFNSLTHLLSQDARLKQAYFAFQEEMLVDIEVTNAARMEKGFLLPMHPNNTMRLLADNMWTQWLGWLRWQQIHNPEVQMPDANALYDCALHHWSLMRPYLKDEFAEKLMANYQRILKPKLKGSMPKAAKRK